MFTDAVAVCFINPFVTFVNYHYFKVNKLFCKMRKSLKPTCYNFTPLVNLCRWG